MRMWNIKSALMCRQHILGEHFEIHKMIGNLRHRGKWTNSLTKNGFLEPQNALKRHNRLVKEMLIRGWKHQSPLDTEGVKLPRGKVNIKKSIKDITQRCKNCRKLIK